jgi:sulfatase modifying factor 1
MAPRAAAEALCAVLTALQASLGGIPTGYEYRLPTEAEWEYACRAGTTTEFHFGPDLFCNQALFAGTFRSPFYLCNNGIGTVPVASYLPKRVGLYDMHGSVHEWCLDSYAPFSSAAVTNPFVTGGANRIFRGGSWTDNSNHCRSASRGYTSPVGGTTFQGFRVVLAPILVP